AGVLAHLLERELLVAHHLAKALDSGERGAELVADDGDELALRAVEALQLLDRLALPCERLHGRECRGRLVAEQSEHAAVVFGVHDRWIVRADPEGAERATASQQWDREAGAEARLLTERRTALPGLIVPDDERLSRHEDAADDALARLEHGVVRHATGGIEVLCQ